MAIQLWIDDGDPWYLSPDIWAVPGDDPNGPPGMPIASVPAYLWARVHNRGTTAVSNATIKYYWANPSTVITPSTATLVGTSFVSLAAGETKEVLCLTQWNPVWVNNGHECLIAETFHASDPLPPRGPNDPFDPPAHRHVAQLNLNLAVAKLRSPMVLCFAAGSAPGFGMAETMLRARRAPVESMAALRRTLALERLPAEWDEIKEFGIQPYRCGDRIDDVGTPNVVVRLKQDEQRGMALTIKLPERAKPGGGALFLVEQFVGDRLVGGIGVLVLSDSEEHHAGTKE